MSRELINSLNQEAAARAMPRPGYGRGWSGSAKIGTIYKIKDTDGSRVGNCWMKGRLQSGDMLLCVAHSGDCFYNYILLVPIYNHGGKVQLQSTSVPFGAYQIGEKVSEVDDETFLDLKVGGAIEIES